jgi:CBS domain-containing protein
LGSIWIEQIFQEAIMITVRQILKAKGNQVVSVAPATTVKDALKVMLDKEIGAVLVMEGEKIRGIFSERDYARRTTREGCVDLFPVEKVMTCVLTYTGLDQSVEDCMGMMTDKHIRHLPVVDEGKLVGLISIGDIVKALIADKDGKIKEMENYIEGRGYGR